MSAETSHAPRRPDGRRTYLVDRAFQFKYIRLFAGIGAGGVLLLGALAHRVHTAALASGEGGSAGTTLVWLTALGTVGMAGVMGLLGLLFTHRVAGPVYVMSLYVSALAAGRYPRLRPLRQKDELRGFFDRFAEAVERIREREAEEARALSRALDALRPLATSAEARAALDTLSELQARKSQAIENRT